MVTSREEMLREKYKAMIDKKMISIGDIDDLMCAVDKVFMNIRSAEESRDKWRAKYSELKKEIKDE